MTPALNMDDSSPVIAKNQTAPAGTVPQEAYYSEQERTALLFMLEDLERSQKRIEQAHQEWIAAMDTIADPIFMHDQDYRVIRCNRAYAERAGMTVREVIGKPYYEAFPKLDGPLPHCCKSLQQAEEEEVQLADGEVFVSRSFSVRGDDGRYLYSLHVMEDITERKRMQQALQESEEKFRQISATAQDAILMMDSAGRIVFWNSAAEKMFGYAAEETLGRELHALIVPERFRDAFHKNHPAFVATGQGAVIGKTLELVAFGKNRAEFPVELSVSTAKLGEQWHAVGFIRDITERKLAVEELRLRAQMLDGATDSVFLHDLDGNFVYLNEAAWKSRGYTRDELMAMNLHVLDTPEKAELIETRMRQLMKNGHAIFESAHRCKDGSVMPIEVSTRLIESGGHQLILSAARDITERKLSEKMFRESERRYRSLFDNMLDGFAYCRMLYENNQPYDFIYIDVNAAFEQLTGLINVVGKKVSDVIPGIRESNPELFESYGRVVAGGKPEKLETYVAALDIWFSLSVYSAEKECFVALFDNITKRKQSEQSLLKLNRAFKTLSAGNHELVHATDEAQLLQAMCRVIVETGGYSAAWVGYVQHDAEKTVRPMAQYGFEPGYVDALQITWVDSERGQGPTGKAVRDGMTQIVQNVVSDPDYAPWREQALKHEYASAIALPLHGDSEAFGNLTIYAVEANAFDQGEVALLEEMAGDLAFGIRMLRLRQEQQHSAEQIRQGLEGTIQAIAGMVEMRDPYTAGHQRRVADLAAAIAVAMGLPEEQVRGIHLAGTIHDLGKIQTPAEILSKPGKLSASEFSLIKEHPQNGYEILKDIEFPWPIAQMVWQHHEKLDGSGYPQGLKGNEILLEAKIMTVADVMEAMSSHRPYRPGLGIDAALTEITEGRGTHYDPDAVDACIKLFKEAGFVFG